MQAQADPAAQRRKLEARARAREEREVRKARQSPEAFIEYALPHEKTGRRVLNAPFHREWQDFLSSHRLAVLIAPVEHAKTQQVAVGRVLFELGKNPALRICIYSNPATQAEKLLRQIRLHIERNPRVRRVFPNLRPSENPEDPWHSSQIVVQRMTFSKDPSVQAMGIGGPPGPRWDGIVLDDVLDFDNTRTEEQRKKIVEWFDTTVFTRLTDGGFLWVIGTPWHPDDLLHELERRPGFACKRYCAVENPDSPAESWIPIWAGAWSQSRLIERWRNTPEMVFARKYLCRVRLDALARFKQAWLDRALDFGKGLSLTQEAPKAPGGVRTLPCFTGVDIGIGEGEESALSCIFTIALRDDGKRQLVSIESGHWQAPEILDRLEDKYRRYGAYVMVESNAAQVFITQLAGERFPVQAFYTGTNKWDEEWGVESLAVEFRNMQWIVPSGRSGRSQHPEIAAWYREMLYFNPSTHTGDRLMASWLAREAARRFAAPRTGPMDTQTR